MPEISLGWTMKQKIWFECKDKLSECWNVSTETSRECQNRDVVDDIKFLRFEFHTNPRLSLAVKYEKV